MIDLENIKLNSNFKTKYNSVFYWTKKNPVISSIIFDKILDEKAIIFDPFMGSGSSLNGSLLCSKDTRFVGVEINEMPLKNLLFQMNLNEEIISNIRVTFEQFKKKFSNYYEYYLEELDEKIILIKTFFDFENKMMNPKKFVIQRQNGTITTIDEENYRNSFSTLKQKFLKKNYDIDVSKMDNCKLIENSRIAVNKNTLISDLFSPINYKILIELKKISNSREGLKFILSQVLQLCKFTDKSSQSQFIFWYPKKNALDRNILETISSKIKYFENKILNKQNEFSFYESKKTNNFNDLRKYQKSFYLVNKPSQKITKNEIPDKSVDLIFTDPPYFDQVPFSEYLQLWNFFVGYKNNLNDEIIFSNRKIGNKNKQDYLEKLKEAFSVAKDKLKENCFALIYFKDTNFENVENFVKTINDSGLNFKDIIHIPRKIITYKQNNDISSTLTGESIFIFKKEKKQIRLDKQKLQDHQIENLIIDFVKSNLSKQNNESLTKMLDQGLLKLMILNNALSYVKTLNKLKKILQKHFIINDKNQLSSL